MSDVPPQRVIIPGDVTASLSADLREPGGVDGLLPDDDPGAYGGTGAKLLRNHLPAAVLERLTAWRREPEPWLTVGNLPRPRDFVPTPRDGFADENALTVPNLVHLGLLRLLGVTPVAYRWENEGRLMRNVAPRPGSAGALTSWGSTAPLDWHTDDSVLDHHDGAGPADAIPHYLSFYGMRNEERVPTDLLDVDTVLAGLPRWTHDDLRRPEFAVSAPESYAPADGDRPAREAVPLLWTLPDGHDAVRYGPGRITGRTTRAVRALTRFEQRLGELEGGSVLVGAGDFHIFDNRRVLHRRVPFQPAAQETARWLRRCYARARQD
ncbi:TauD/TfdA family dioxygenase [Streptomyces sp. PTM05]|uniref:TauD/TfdA family dioxygenase n=1 Tax=Streptantibioticus parmotrematis TaxID=2873249 RepID=A0ABS7QYP6_9ACTN|nr:TauD/TfdA family dioxygenase [Streptantibioticus parmotrematis]MBY8888337.1 TauD/TfdA family dioxygenase [Streptantibioticus parmotrematis]